MVRGFMVGLAMGGVVAGGLTGSARATVSPIPIKISLLKWGGDPRVGRLYKLVSKPSAELSLPDCATGSPIDLGGSLRVTIGEDALTCELPPGGWSPSTAPSWKALGRCPDKHKGYKYLNKFHDESNPCKVVIVKGNLVKVLAKGVGGIGLPGDTNPDVEVSLTVGAERYCALASQPHSKEKAETLIKMKDQEAPLECKRCGDDAVNQPNEECDGTDDGACTCAGTCLPPGDPNECTCAPPECGNDCTEGGEQCDGTDADECSGLCLANCTCPLPICNNGVKEAGEECDPAGSATDCSPGNICGGFCTCVPNVACDCGSPDPTLYKFTSKAPVEPSCGTTDGAPPIDNIECMALYIGGGEGAQTVPIAVEDEGTTKYQIAQCKGTDLTLTHTTPAQAGPLHCSEGKKCSASSDNAGDPCLRDHQCPGGTCEARCFFLAPLPIFSLDLPQLGSCVLSQVAEDAQGGLNCETSESFLRQPLDSRIHLTLFDQSPTTPGYQPCPMCLGGTLWVPNSGNCEGGPNQGLPCTPQSTAYDVHECCAGGENNSKPCFADSDCPGSTCEAGCSGYPTSYDCPPHPLSDVSGLLWVMELSPGAIVKTADAGGSFCGWCRDVDDEGSGCFEGDPDEGPPAGDQGCPDSSLIACRPATYHGPGGGDPADIEECGDPLSCTSNLDCRAPYETCQQRSPGAWRDATVRSITVHGKLPADPDLRDKLPHRGAVGANFCIPPTFVPAIENHADVGGPGAFSLEGDHQLSPGGAFLDLRPGSLD